MLVSLMDLSPLPVDSIAFGPVTSVPSERLIALGSLKSVPAERSVALASVMSVRAEQSIGQLRWVGQLGESRA